jgi:hypothetical protein
MAGDVMRKAMVVGVASLLLSGIGVAYAQDETPPARTTADDLRCVAVGIIMGTMADANSQESSKLMTLYYLGRIEGSGTNVDLKSQIPESIKLVQGNKYRIAAVECGKHLGDVAGELQDIAKILDEPQASPLAPLPKRPR